MPSVYIDYGRQGRPLPTSVLVILLIGYTAAVVASFCGYAIKIYVLATGSFEGSDSLDACGWAILRYMHLFAVIAFSLMIGGFSLAVLPLCYKRENIDGGELDMSGFFGLLAEIGQMAVLIYWFMAFGTNVFTWLGSSEPEEVFLFYAEFYDDDFSNCSSAQDLLRVELAVGVYKVEHFIVMIGIILACPCYVAYFRVIEGWIHNSNYNWDYRYYM